MQVHMSLTGNTKILLAVALSQAVVTPFTKNDWYAYCDATGAAHMVHFRPEHAAKLATALGIDHWVPEYTVVILDEMGLSWNGSSPVNGHAWAVQVDMDVSGVADPGTPAEYWRTDKDRPYGGALEQVIATLPESVRSTVMACPQAKAKLGNASLHGAAELFSAMDAAAALAQVRQPAAPTPQPSTSEDRGKVEQALELLQQVDMSGYGGLYDAVPWADLECFAKGRVQHPHQDVANRGRVWIYKNEMGLTELRGQRADGYASATMFQDSMETVVINWFHLQYDHMGDAKPKVTWAAPTADELPPTTA